MNFARNRVFDSHTRAIRLPKSKKKRFCPFRFFHSLFLYNTFNSKAVCPCITQVSTRRMCDQHVPLAYIMRLPVHCSDDTPPDSFQRIAENVPFRMSSRWLLNIAGICFMPSFSKSLAYCLRFLTRYQYFRFPHLLFGLCWPSAIRRPAKPQYDSRFTPRETVSRYNSPHPAARCPRPRPRAFR